MASNEEAISIRVATEDDVPVLRRVLRSAIEGIAFRDYPPEVLVHWGADTPDAAAAALRVPPSSSIA